MPKLELHNHKGNEPEHGEPTVQFFSVTVKAETGQSARRTT
jgi:hypothetical protein